MNNMPDYANNMLDIIKKEMKNSCKHAEYSYGQLCVHVEPKNLIKLVQFLMADKHLRFDGLVDICGVDYPSRALRFDVVYHLLSYEHNQRIRIKLAVDDDTQVPSLNALYPAANWYEREVWDMYGVYFSDHPDLRRILTDYGFDGHPQRRDFPLTGYVEMRYDDEAKKVIYEPVELRQDYRNFDYTSPWENNPADNRPVLPGDEKAH